MAGSFLKIKYTFRDSSERLVVFTLRRLAGVAIASALIAVSLSVLALKLTVNHFTQSRGDEIQSVGSAAPRDTEAPLGPHAAKKAATESSNEEKQQNQASSASDENIVTLNARAAKETATETAEPRAETPTERGEPTENIQLSAAVHSETQEEPVAEPTATPSQTAASLADLVAISSVEFELTSDGLVAQIGVRAQRTLDDKVSGSLIATLGDLNPKTDRFSIKRFVSKRISFSTEETTSIAELLKSPSARMIFAVSVTSDNVSEPALALNQELDNATREKILNWKANSGPLPPPTPQEEP